MKRIIALILLTSTLNAQEYPKLINLGNDTVVAFSIPQARQIAKDKEELIVLKRIEPIVKEIQLITIQRELVHDTIILDNKKEVLVYKNKIKLLDKEVRKQKRLKKLTVIGSVILIILILI